MDDPGAVRLLQRGSNLARNRHGALRRHPPVLLEHVGERSPLDVPHRQEAQSLVLPDVVDADHVLVADLAREEKLAAEALDDRGIASQVRAKDFQRGIDVELLVARPIDDPHPSHAGDSEHAIPAGDEGARGKPARDVDARHRRRQAGGGYGRRVSRNGRRSLLPDIRRINHRSGSPAAARSSRRGKTSAGGSGDFENAPPEDVQESPVFGGVSGRSAQDLPDLPIDPEGREDHRDVGGQGF